MCLFVLGLAGSVMCGLLSFPDVLQCNEEDWDVSGVASSRRTCGAGFKYNKQQKRFTFEFGGQNFIISKTLEAHGRICKCKNFEEICGFWV